jgi:hypothetical protein
MSEYEPSLAFTEEDYQSILQYTHGNLERNMAFALATDVEPGDIVTYQSFADSYWHAQNLEMGPREETERIFHYTRKTLKAKQVLTACGREGRSILYTLQQPQARKVLAFSGVELRFGLDNDMPLSTALGIEGNKAVGGAYLRYRLLADLLSPDGQAIMSVEDRHARMKLPGSHKTLHCIFQQYEALGVLEKSTVVGRPNAWRIMEHVHEPFAKLVADIGSLKTAEGVERQSAEAHDIISNKALVAELLHKYHRHMMRHSHVSDSKGSDL